jgi:SDR family mycofactocin-dependent oxidoreductase
MSQFRGKTVVISGAARGQGRSHTLRFAQEGANVVAFDICTQIATVPFAMPGPEDLDETVRLAREQGGQILGAIADIRDAQQVESVFGQAIDTFGSVDVVVANAGIVGNFAPVWEVPDEVFRDVIDVNLIGSWHVAKAGISAMLSHDVHGVIVVIGSGASLKGLPNLAPYVASKHALVGLVRTAARETAPYGIRVNLVAPGSVNTPMFINDATARLYAPDDDAPDTETLLERSRAVVPMGMPYVQPEDITEAVLYLASDAARYVTGAVLPVDGGSAIP